ncbi:MAG: hypothetical protein ABEJ43_00755 [Haloferacaceae archaeon]
MRALHALLAATLAVAVVVVPVGGATSPAPGGSAGSVAPPVSGDAPGTAPLAQIGVPQTGEARSLNGTVDVLAPADGVPNRSTTTRVVLDIGPAVSVATNASNHALLTRRAVTRVREADDVDAALARELDRLKARTDALGRSQRAALRAFVAGEADARTTLLRLVRIDRAARALDDRRRSVVAAARARGANVPTERSAALDRELALYTGAVRARVAASLTGDAPPTRVYVSATRRGVTLATLTESGYVRETYRGGLRRTDGDPLDRQTARQVVAEAYPTVWAARRAVDAQSAQVARVRVTYTGGELAATVGAGNQRVFRDVHRQSFGVAGTNQVAINTRDGLQLVVNRSYPGGPMRVRVRTVDGESVDASITVGPEGGDSTPVGTTGPDGEFWTLTPSERFTIVAIRDQSVVFLTMDPLETPRAGRR